METKFTKGEWKVNNDCFTEVHGLTTSEIGNGKEWLAYVRGNTPEERKANAKLIAAAPDLLESLKNAIYIIETKADGFGVNDLKQAIKKATE